MVDSEDIPLNLSRELLQESALIRYNTGVTDQLILCFHGITIYNRNLCLGMFLVYILYLLLQEAS